MEAFRIEIDDDDNGCISPPSARRTMDLENLDTLNNSFSTFSSHNHDNKSRLSRQSRSPTTLKRPKTRDGAPATPLPDFHAFKDPGFTSKRHAQNMEEALNMTAPSSIFMPPTPVKSPNSSRRLFSESNSNSVENTPRARGKGKQRGNEPTYFERKFINMGVIGQGTFGVVFKVEGKKDGREYAIKQSLKPFRGQKDCNMSLKEVSTLQKINSGVDDHDEDHTHTHAQRHSLTGNCGHEHVLRFFEAWLEDGFLYMQTELCDRGTLALFMESQPCPLPEHLIWDFIGDIALGLRTIHSLQLVHMDVKPDNIFVTSEGFLKIGDFGISVDESTKWELSMEGDRVYLAPECLDSGVGEIHSSSDIFSFGAMVLEMAADVTLPDNGEEWRKLREDRINPKEINTIAESRSDALCDLIVQMLRRDPLQRPSSDDILQLCRQREAHFASVSNETPTASSPSSSSTQSSSSTSTSHLPSAIPSLMRSQTVKRGSTARLRGLKLPPRIQPVKGRHPTDCRRRHSASPMFQKLSLHPNGMNMSAIASYNIYGADDEHEDSKYDDGDLLPLLDVSPTHSSLNSSFAMDDDDNFSSIRLLDEDEEEEEEGFDEASFMRGRHTPIAITPIQQRGSLTVPATAPSNPSHSFSAFSSAADDSVFSAFCPTPLRSSIGLDNTSHTPSNHHPRGNNSMKVEDDEEDDGVMGVVTQLHF